MRNYLFLKPSKNIPFYSPKLIVSLHLLPPPPAPPPHTFFLDYKDKEQAKIAEYIEDLFDCLKYLSAYHKNADYFFKSEQCNEISLHHDRTIIFMLSL